MDKLYYRLLRKGHEVTSEVICAEHYAEASKDGGHMGPLSESEVKRAGYEQRVTPYTGDRDCATCEEARIERERGAA